MKNSTLQKSHMFRILAISVLFLLPFISFSQADFGIKAGGNIYKISSSLPGKPIINWQAGFYSKARVNDKFAIQPELLYTVKGGKLELNNNAVNLKLNYVELNILASYNFYKKVSAELGFNISYLAVFQKNKTPDTLINRKAFSPLSFGLLAGLSIEVKSFDISARYDFGLTQLIDNSNPENSNNPLMNSFNRGCQVSVGYVF